MGSVFVRFYEAIIRLGEGLQSFLLLAMRLYWGYGFFQSGMGKFNNLPKIIEYFSSLNVPFPEANAYIVASFETIGGILLMIGLGSRLICIPLICILCVAYATAHIDALLNIFHDPETFISQSPFNFLVACLVVFCFGPGKFSIDYLLEKKKPNANNGAKS